MTSSPLRPVEIEAYRRARESLADVLDRLSGGSPRTVSTALYETTPPTILSRQDPVVGRYASMLLGARGAAGDHYYVPKIARATAQTIASTYGHDSAELRQAMEIVRTARAARAGKVRPATLDRARSRRDRHLAGHGAAHPRTLRAARRVRQLLLRADRPDLARIEFDAMLDDLWRDTDTGWTVLFALTDFATDLLDVAELDESVRPLERARSWAGSDALPSDRREDALHLVDVDLFEHLLAAGHVRRGGEIASAMRDRARAAGPGGERASVAEHAAGRVALLRHEHREAAVHLRRALDHESEQHPRGPVATRIRNDLLFAVVSAPDDADANR